MSVHYKFKSSLDYNILRFDGMHISVAEIKKKIMLQVARGKRPGFDLQITNSQTKEMYVDDESLIPRNTSLIVARVPVSSPEKKSYRKRSLQRPVDEDKVSGQITFYHARINANLLSSNANEDDKIKAMISQSTTEYDSSNYAKSHSMTGPPPPNYTCFRCRKKGHWIKDCPTYDKIMKRSTGIPRSFMVPVDGPDHKGALLTSSGGYAVPLISHAAYEEVKKEKPPFLNLQEKLEPEPESEIPKELLCTVCGNLLEDAVLISCCGNGFCDECVRHMLLESDNHQCLICQATGVSPDSILPSRYLRAAVLNFRNGTAFTLVKEMRQTPLPQPSHMDSSTACSYSAVEHQVPTTDPVVQKPSLEKISVASVPETVESEINQPLEIGTQHFPEYRIQDEAGENAEQNDENLQTVTPLADEPPPIHTASDPQLSSGQEQYSIHNQYDEENEFGYSPHHNRNMDADSIDKGHVTSTEINRIHAIQTISTNRNYKPRFHHRRRHSSQKRTIRRVERDYNFDRSDYRGRHDYRNRDRPSNADRYSQHSHDIYKRQPRDSTYHQPECDHRPSVPIDFSTDESSFVPDYEEIVMTHHRIEMERSDSRVTPEHKRSKRSRSNFPENKAKRLKQDRPS